MQAKFLLPHNDTGCLTPQRHNATWLEANFIASQNFADYRTTNIYRRVLERCLLGWRRDWDKTVLGASSSSFTPAYEEKIRLLL
jgi:hypothetical protein